jgi:signal transduction histidine kinase
MGENHIPEIASSASITLRIVSDQASLALGSAVREILQNAEDHSESEEPTLFAAGYFRTSRRVTFAVADTGIGIRATLFRKGILLPEEDDGKAIVKAIQPRVTGAGVRGNPQAPNNAGLGLHTTRMFAQDCRGEMFVWSGSNYFRERGRGHSEVTAAPRWRGTLVYVSLYPDQAGAFPLRPRAIGSSDTIEIHFGRGPENSVLFKPPVDAVV